MNVVVTQSGKKVNIADIVLPDDVAKVPLIYQSTMIHAIDEELEKEKSDDSTDTLSKYDL